MDETHTVVVGADGQVVLPAEVLARAGIEEGTRLVLIESPDGLLLATREQLLSSVRGDLAGLDLAGARDGPGEPVHHLPAAAQEGLAGGGQGDLPAAPRQQGHAELRLELADRPAERRLRDVEPLGGAPEMQLLGDREEVPEVSKL